MEVNTSLGRSAPPPRLSYQVRTDGRGLWAGLSAGVVRGLYHPPRDARYAGRGPAGRGGPMLVTMLGGPGID